jgi:hypothetical protein
MAEMGQIQSMAATCANGKDAPKADAATPTIGEHREGPLPL